LGLAYLPEALYQNELEAGRLRRLRSDPKPIPLQIYSIRPLAGAVPAHQLLENAASTAIATTSESSSQPRT